ncbi:MAG: hypothetical protein R2851_08560 [Caldilineaceae bacterium]
MAIGVRTGAMSAGARRMLAPKIFYFCFYAAGSALMPYLGLYYQSLGLTGRYIRLADRHPAVGDALCCTAVGQRGRCDPAPSPDVAPAAISSTIVVVLALSVAAQLLWLAAGHGLCLLRGPHRAPGGQHHAGHVGPRKDNADGNVWGAIGWGVSAAIMGVVIQRAGLHAAFYG